MLAAVFRAFFSFFSIDPEFQGKMIFFAPPSEMIYTVSRRL
jgi:hypothetical protein